MLRDDGSECAPDEPGELVHRGALVGQGYWNDADKTAERYKLLPAGIGGRLGGLQLSGDGAADAARLAGDPRITAVSGPEGLSATILTPRGEVVL